MTQLDMQSLLDGDTYDKELDSERLNGQLKAVYEVMKDGDWRTLDEIQGETGGSQASISARLRDFRKEKFGGYIVERRRKCPENRGVFEYRLVI